MIKIPFKWLIFLKTGEVELRPGITKEKLIHLAKEEMDEK